MKFNPNVITLGIALTISLSAGYVVIDTNQTEQNKSAAWSIVTLLVGYLVPSPLKDGGEGG